MVPLTTCRPTCIPPYGNVALPGVSARFVPVLWYVFNYHHGYQRLAFMIHRFADQSD